MSIENYAAELKTVFHFNDKKDELGLYEEYIDADASSLAVGVRILAGYAVELAGYVSALDKPYDAERVHCLRIVLRKMKAVIGGRPRLFSPEDTEKALEILSAAAFHTGEARDTDILLSSAESYFQELPECFAGGRKGVLSLLKKRASAKRRALKKYFKSGGFEPAYGELCGLLKKYYGDMPEETAETAGIKAFAEARLADRYAKALDFIEITEKPNDAQIHELRILCKKLRYSIEIFGSFAEMKKAGKAVNKLKELQDVLGFYNDLSVQTGILSSMAGGVQGAELGALASVMTIMGALKDELTEEVHDICRSMRKKDKIFEIKKKRIRRYAPAGKEEETV